MQSPVFVAVFLNGGFLLVGQLVRRPTIKRRLVIRSRDVRGDVGITRMWGLKDRDVQVLRVVGVMNRLPIANEPD